MHHKEQKDSSGDDKHDKADLMVFYVNATNDRGMKGRYPAGLVAKREDMARRWLVNHFMEHGFRCIGIERVVKRSKMPKKFPIMTNYKEPKEDELPESDSNEFEELL